MDNKLDNFWKEKWQQIQKEIDEEKARELIRELLDLKRPEKPFETLKYPIWKKGKGPLLF